MKRLNGWQRIGVIASIVWAFGAFIHVNSWYADESTKYAISMVKSCEAAAPEYREPGIKDCWSSYQANVALDREGFWADAAIVSLIPIPVGWLTVYLILGLLRWIKAGFARKP